MRRWLLLGSPALAVAIVAWATLGGRSQEVQYAQVLGGPTREGPTFAVLIRALAVRGERVVPVGELPLRASARVGDSVLSIDGVTDASGALEARFEFGATPPADPWLRIETQQGRRVLADGRAGLDVERWQAGARRTGGWLGGETSGELHVRVAAATGTLAVPFDGALLVQVHAGAAAVGAHPPGAAPAADAARAPDGHDGPASAVPLVASPGTGGSAAPGILGPLAGAAIHLEPTGATLAAADADPADVEHATLTDARGIARVPLRPLEHAPGARVVARQGPRRGEWYGALPVVPGALLATRSGERVEVRSPIPRERAYVSFVTQRERLGGAVVPLTPEPDGGARGSRVLGPELFARIEAEPAWAVVSGEPDKRSAGAVGWPIGAAQDDAPPLTFGVADAVLLDGRAAALEQAKRTDDGRRRGAAGLLLIAGALLGALFWAELRAHARSNARTPRPASNAASSDTAAPALASRGLWLAAAAGCIALAFLALAWFTLRAR